MSERGSIQPLFVLLLVAVLAFAVLVAVGVVSCGGDPPSDLPPLEAFVKAVHVHGVPYEVASRYDPAEVDRLLDWLDRSEYAPYRSNIVIVIGMIGPQRDEQVERLIDFIAAKDGAGPLPVTAYQAKQAAVMSLGYAAHAMKSSQRAVGHLIASALPSQWADGRADWESPYGESPAVVQRHFARLSIIALGLSGRPEAFQKLQKLRDDPVGPPADRDENFRGDNRDIVLEAIATNVRVNKHRLEGYYDR